MQDSAQRLMARIEHHATTNAALIDSRLGSERLAALFDSRLEAERLAALRELRASRRRTVAAAEQDAAGSSATCTMAPSSA